MPARSTALFIERSIREGTRWAVFEPNGRALWGELAAAATAFLQGLFAQGAFAGAPPAESFFARCDATTTSEADRQAGIANLVVGFATAQPAEFVIPTIPLLIQP